MVRAAATKETKLGGGGGLLGAGEHHIVVETVTVEDGQYGQQVAAKIVSLASKPDDMVGRSRKVYLDVEGEHAGRFWTAAIALGVTTLEEFTAAQETGEGADIDEQEMVGHECFVRVFDGKNKDGKAYQGVEFLAIDDPKAAKFPRDLNSPLMKARAKNGNGGGGDAKAPPAPPADDIP